MKNIFILFFLVVSIVSNAQIKEIKNKTEEISNLTQVTFFIASLNKTVEEDNYFVIYSNDKNQNEVEEMKFYIGKKETVLQFKDILLNVIKHNTKLKQIELEGNKFILKCIGGRRVTIDIINKDGVETSMRYLNNRTIEKVFPKDLFN